jgi:ceramide glucosyltransferase
MPLVRPLMLILGFASLGLAASYGLLTVAAVIVWRLRPAERKPLTRPPITILKPLCGAEPGLYQALRSFCEQDYPEYQIVFGMRDQADPARLVAERLQAEFPALPINIVINPQLHGSNSKVSNLINMLPHALHDVLAMADSDAFVKPDYLTAVTAPLLDRKIGLVTCIYRGMPTRWIWSRLGAMYVNEWYVPTVLVAWLFGHENYVSGQTVCLRRETLHAIGGLRTLSNQLADDYRLGELVRGLGLRILLSPYVVTGEHHEPSFHAVLRHELRWMRTLHVLRPRSFRCLFLTFSFPLAMLGIGLASAESVSFAAWLLFAIAAVSRLTLHFVHRRGDERPPLADFWLLPLRDLLLCWVWCQSFFESQVTWRGSEFGVDPDGVMRRLNHLNQDH